MSTEKPVIEIKSKGHAMKSTSRSRKRKRTIQTCDNPLCKGCFGPLYDFWTSEPDEYKMLKMLLGFPFGALLAFGLYSLVIKPMSLGDDTRKLLGGLLGLGMASGYATSVQIRCIALLLIPTFFGKAGRSYIGTFAIAFLIAGPIENIVDNGQDITRSLACAAQLAANHTATKWKFRLQPVGNVMKDMQREGYMLNRIGKQVNRAFKPLKKEIRGEDEEVVEMKAETAADDKREAEMIERQTKVKDDDPDGKKIEQKYKKKLDYRCEDVFNAGVQKCKDVFNRAHGDCMDELPPLLNIIICSPCKATFLCNIVKVFPAAFGATCNSDQLIDPSFGKMYKASEDTIANMDKNVEVDIQYKVVPASDDIDMSTADETRQATMRDFKRGRYWVEFVMTLLRRLLGFTFLIVVFGAYKYHNHYLHDIKFENMYITSYFRKIDARRKQKGKKFLLPLKKTEAGSCIFPTSTKMMKSEKKKLGKGTFLLLSRALLSGLVFFTDYLLYHAMDIIRRNSRIDYRQAGTNMIDVKVNGTGFISEIVRLFMTGFNTKHNIDSVSTNVDCLPNPVALDKKYFGYVYGVYAVIWVLIFLEAYGLRLRKVIAGYFYRKREKQRVLYCYNNMLKQRKCFFRHMKRVVKRKAKKQQLSARSGLLYSLRRQFPKLCSCLSVCQTTKDKCLICGDKAKGDFLNCDTPACDFVYCRECWFDLKRRCYACLPLEEFSSTDSDGTASSDDNADVY